MSIIANMTVANIVDLYNSAIEDYGVNGFKPVDRFKSKAHAIERLEALCVAGNLAMTYDGDKAVIVDDTPVAASDEDASDEDASDEAAAIIAEATQNASDALVDMLVKSMAPSDEAASDEAPAPIGAELSDAKGGIARSGFAYGSAEWLIANPRGTPAREAYRKARRLAARNMRKALRNAKLEAATAE